jgi:hypothetical protein
MTTAKKVPAHRVRDRKHHRRGCIDCADEGIITSRKAPHPGPRCATHHRAKRGKRKGYNQETRWKETYNITAEQYWFIYESQGGVCAICRRATGAARALSVDHDHACCDGPKSCGSCVRSLLCKRCNMFLGHLRDDPEMFERILMYLHRPPGKEILAQWNNVQSLTVNGLESI